MFGDWERGYLSGRQFFLLYASPFFMVIVGGLVIHYWNNRRDE